MRVQLIRSRARRLRRREDGAVAMITAVLLVPFCLLLAFTLDLGMAYAQAQAFASGADSAALAVAGAKQDALDARPSAYPDCAALRAADGGQALALAKRQVEANRAFGLRATGAAPDVQVSTTLSCVDANGAPSPTGVLRVDVTVARDVPTSFGALAGVRSVHAEKSATAGLSGSLRTVDVFPLAICDQQADAIRAAAAAGPPYATTTIETDKVWQPGCGSAGNRGSGNWGWLDCTPGPSNGQPALLDAIANGCRDGFTLSESPATVTVDGTPGNRFNPQVRGAVTAVSGRTYPFPVYDLVSGQGSNTSYRVVGFLSLTVQGVDGDEIRVSYAAWTPVGEFTRLCGLGAPSCTTYSATGIGLIG